MAQKSSKNCSSGDSDAAEVWEPLGEQRYPLVSLDFWESVAKGSRRISSPGRWPGYLHHTFEQVREEIRRKNILNGGGELLLGVGLPALLYPLPDEGSEMKQKACGLGVILTCNQIPWMPPGSLAFQKLNLNLCLCAVGGAYLPHRLVVSLSGNKGKGSRGPLQGSWESPRENPHCFWGQEFHSQCQFVLYMFPFRWLQVFSFCLWSFGNHWWEKAELVYLAKQTSARDVPAWEHCLGAIRHPRNQSAQQGTREVAGVTVVTEDQGSCQLRLGPEWCWCSSSCSEFLPPWLASCSSAVKYLIFTLGSYLWHRCLAATAYGSLALPPATAILAQQSSGSF